MKIKMKTGFLSLLTILFIALKLTGVIAWSWWWVLAPTWIGLGLFLILAALVLAAHAFSKPVRW